MAIKEVFIEQVGAVTISRNRQALRFKIAIRPDGRIRVTIPWLASFRTGEKFLIEHLPWIDETRRKLALNPTEPKHIHPGHLFTTRNYEYHICPAEVKNLRIRYAYATKQVYFEYPVNLAIEDSELQKRLAKMIENVLRFDAKKYLPVRIAELANKLGYSYQKITIKNNRSNWGSCSTRKNINLNLHLMRLPDKLIDYVLVHELVHTIIPNHGPDFKATMLHHFNDMAQIDKELKKIGTGLASIAQVK